MAFRKYVPENKNFNSITISLASPEMILEASSGEVLKPETINYRTYKPERDGLFCERIFGPVKDYECHCGKYKRIRYKGIVCDRCGVEVTEKKVRRERMGHIKLVVPVAHIWFFKTLPNKMGALLGIPTKKLDTIIYYEKYVVINPGLKEASGLKYLDFLSEEEYFDIIDSLPQDNQYLDDTDPNKFVAKMGADAIHDLLARLDLDELSYTLRDSANNETSQQRKADALKRLKVVESFREANTRMENRPEWMIVKVVPVIPPELRPLVPLDGGRFATSDLNDLYRRVIIRNNRLKRLIEIKAPDVILRNEKRMLQEAVDSLFDNSRKASAVKTDSNRALKSLSDSLKGKQGRFRQNLLGKRVDYSGRSVIVVGPELKLNECGLPKDMASELFKPFIIRKLLERGIVKTVKSAKKMVDRKDPVVWDILESVLKGHPVMLNRAPTLHRLGIQAFQPKLIEGKAIQLHPLACTAFNADFDGDQMAVHVPLTKKAQQEAIDLLMATNNLLKPANGEPITIPNKEMAMGIYYHTVVDNKFKVFPGIFSSKDEAYHVYQIGKLGLRQLVKVRIASLGKVIETTVGRLQFNDLLPVEFGYINEAVGAKKIKQLVTTAIKEFDKQRVANLIDAIKNLGFEAATISGISVSVSDCEMIENKDEIIEAANKKVEEIQEQYNEGMIAIEERKRLSFDVWIDTTEDIAEKTWSTYSEDNAVKVLIESGGTRASKDQVKQLAAMRGLVVDPNGNIVEMPTKSNFREGLTIFEYVTSARGSRKGLTDSAIKTADAGYLTRRLCDVSHDAIIRLEDCKTEEFITISDEDRTDVFATRIAGRILARDIVLNKKVVAQKGTLITIELAKELVKAGLKTADVRSPLTCEASKGLCATCYGIDFSTSKMIELGVPVGIVAAQSIGEPGTQLTMRTKHSGGILGADVTQGLPRVEELLEARNPKNQAIISEIAGKVSIEEGDKDITVTIRTTSSPVEEVEYKLSVNAELLIKDGDLIHVGQQLTTGSVSLKELALVKGLLQAQQYTINQVQAVYESQGIPIHDKHFETIIRKMCDKLQIESAGDTDFLTGEVIEKTKFIEANDEAMAAGGEPATAKVLFLGITRSSLFTASWLSAASFQHTKNVLTDASAAGKIDYLDGLKENVIIGRLIPTSKERASIEL